MDTLIIGCGYLGRRVARLWRDEGHRVFATTRGSAAELPPGVEPIPCDVVAPKSLQSLPAVETVLFAVGFDRSSGQSMRSVYVDGLANVLDHLPAPQKFIYISSGSVYGQTGGEWIDEDAPTEPQEESGKIVLAAEEVLRSKLPDAVVLRFGGIYGPGRLLRQKSLLAGEAIVGDGNKWLNLIHVDDGAHAVLAAERYARPGRIYNVCDGHPVQRHVFYAALAQQLGAAPPKFVQPPPDQPTPPHEKANRRLRNQRLREELQATLQYDDYVRGIAASL